MQVAEGMTQAPNSLSCHCSRPRDWCETMRNSHALTKLALFANPKIVAEPVDLVHSLVQDCHDPDVAV